MSTLHNQLAVAEQEDVARGIRLLLRHPMITQQGDEAAFDLIRRRRQPLQSWFDYHCGWTLTVEPRLGYARLAKVGIVDGSDRPALRPRAARQPFDRRRYTLFCVVAAELLDTPVTTIGLVADRIVQACATDEALPAFDSSRQAERRALVDVLRLLEDLGAITLVDGSSDSYVQVEDAKVLFQVNTTLLIRLLSAPRGASSLAVTPGEVTARFEELLQSLREESRYASVDDERGPGHSSVQRNLWLRHSLLRRLFDEPVVYRADLSSGQLDYLDSPTGRQIIRRAATQAGLVLEERAEGYLLIDPDAIATDDTFPEGGSIAKVVALKLLDRLQQPPREMSSPDLARATEQILDENPTWARVYRVEGGNERLAHEALGHLLAFRLVRGEGDWFRPLPAAARYLIDVRTETITDEAGTV